MGETNKKKRDLNWMIQLCEPTPSSQQKLLHCPFARESQVFDEQLFMSSLGPTQPDDPNHIIMLSIPDDDDAVFLTPPENDFRSQSQSDQMKGIIRVSSQGGVADEAESTKITVSETQPIDVGINNVVVVLDGSDLNNETLILGNDTAEKGTGNVVSLGKEEASLNVGSGSKKIVDLVVGNGNGVNGDVSFDEIDKFAYDDANKKQERRKLPETVQGGEGSDGVEKEIDFHDILEMWESTDGDGEEVDFLETAMKRGMVLPRPRWWDPDW